MLVDNGEPREIWGTVAFLSKSRCREINLAEQSTKHRSTAHRYTGDGARNEEGMTGWAWERCYKGDCTAGR